MVKVQEYRPGEYMVNTTKEEALRIIKSLATQLANNDCNRERIEFMKRREDDVTYFSIAVDESATEYQVILDIAGIYKKFEICSNIIMKQCNTLEKAKEFRDELRKQSPISEIDIWIKEVQV